MEDGGRGGGEPLANVAECALSLLLVGSELVSILLLGVLGPLRLWLLGHSRRRELEVVLGCVLCEPMDLGLRVEL